MSSLKESEEQTSPPATPLSLGLGLERSSVELSAPNREQINQTGNYMFSQKKKNSPERAFSVLAELVVPINGVFVPLDGVPGRGAHAASAAAATGGLAVLVWRVRAGGGGGCCGRRQVHGLQGAGGVVVVVVVVRVSVHAAHALQPVGVGTQTHVEEQAESRGKTKEKEKKKKKKKKKVPFLRTRCAIGPVAAPGLQVTPAGQSTHPTPRYRSVNQVSAPLSTGTDRPNDRDTPATKTHEPGQTLSCSRPPEQPTTEPTTQPTDRSVQQAKIRSGYIHTKNVREEVGGGVEGWGWTK
ncbi:hypothetical protein EYF80_056286 [Liparis tanakae]|uniref:Uncharacterized protein n=1 Tax=Liparis tanakae TaxID=230148 RepID=A0A4Z2EXS7_9TELE|nr:hypothetical protein EYF80_056286 [Liparis tanakae]